MHDFQPIANGLRTDHPIPDLPFVDDSHIPVKDGHAVEAVGRNRAQGMWGRFDRSLTGEEWGWLAFTTEPSRYDLAWCVRFHPEHGISVVLYRDADAPGVHQDWWETPLLFRAGGYWLDGTTWYRPMQVWDAATEEYLHRPVPSAVSVTAADLLASRGRHADPARARVLTVDKIDLDRPPFVEHWHDHLALWASHRGDDDWPLDSCVVTLSAPELVADQLVGAGEFAELAGIAAATLRSYMSRGQDAVPPPQATISGRNMWARPVAEDWAEQRSHSSDAVSAAVSSASSHRQDASNPVGITNLWDRYTRTFYSELWDRDLRKRWALRWRTPASVREVAEALAWDVAGNLTDIVPTRELGITVRHAVLDEMASQQKTHEEIGTARLRDASDGNADVDDDPVFYGVTVPVERMMKWLISHDPHIAQATVAEIIGEAGRRLDISREVVERTVRVMVNSDGDMDEQMVRDFLDRALPPHDEA